MTERILKRALAQPPTPVDRDAVPGLGMLGSAPEELPVRHASEQQERSAGEKGGAP